MLKIILLIPLLISFKLSAQFKYGESLYSIRFFTPIGCQAELQSNNPNFDSTKLKHIIPLLEGMGYYEEFGHVSIFPYNQRFNEKEQYIKFAEERYSQIQIQTYRLMKTNFPAEFDTLKQAHLHNRAVRMEFATVLLDWVKCGDDELLRQNLLALNNDSEVSELLNSILKEEVWEEKFLSLSVKMGNLFNKLNKDKLIPNLELEEKLFEQNQIAIVHEPDCRD